MPPTAEQLHYATATFAECTRLVQSGRTQTGLQYLLCRWRDIPAVLQTRFLQADVLTLPAATQADIHALLRVRSREAGITERTAALRQQMRAHQAQMMRLDVAAAAIQAAYRTRGRRLLGIAALFALAALGIALSTVL
jgi:hypothetical protein